MAGDGKTCGLQPPRLLIPGTLLSVPSVVPGKPEEPGEAAVNFVRKPSKDPAFADWIGLAVSKSVEDVQPAA